MKERTALGDRIGGHPFMRKLPKKFIPVLTEHAMAVKFEENEVIFRKGDPANRFYLMETGAVSLETQVNEETIRIFVVQAGEVLGWSWLFPPYVWRFDARAMEPTCGIFLYGTRLREICEEQTEWGYALMKATSAVLIDRLQSTRGELLKQTAGFRIV